MVVSVTFVLSLYSLKQQLLLFQFLIRTIPERPSQHDFCRLRRRQRCSPSQPRFALISYSGLLPDPFLSEEKHKMEIKLYLIIKKMVEIESLLSLSHLPLVLAEVHCELD